MERIADAGEIIKVKILITTYNQKDYVERAIESILAQKTTFKYKIFIADDASRDGTSDILMEYQKKYPNIIDVLLSEENIGSLRNSNRLFDKLECEYFSFLDGDDYWLSDYTLQQRVDFLDKNKEYSMCGGNTYFLCNNEYSGKVVNEKFLKQTYTFNDYLGGKTIPFIHTSSIVVRNLIFSEGLPKPYITLVNTFEESAVRGEDFRFLLHLERGKIYLFDDDFSVYRIHENGMWQGATKTKQMLETTIGFYFYRRYWNDYMEIFEKRFVKNYRKLQQHLIEVCRIDMEYTLSEQETKLLCELYLAVGKLGIDWESYKIVKRSIRERIQNRLRCWK